MQSVRAELETFQPRMRRATTSLTTVTSTGRHIGQVRHPQGLRALHPAASNTDALALQLPPDLARAIDLDVLIPVAPDVPNQYLITLSPRRAPGRTCTSRRLPVVRRRGDRQHPVDRLDLIGRAVFIHQRLQISAAQPILPTIELIAAHGDSCSPRCACTRASGPLSDFRGNRR
jgi:hypothetical protein